MKILLLIAILLISCERETPYCWECIHTTTAGERLDTVRIDTTYLQGLYDYEARQYEFLNSDSHKVLGAPFTTTQCNRK